MKNQYFIYRQPHKSVLSLVRRVKDGQEFVALEDGHSVAKLSTLQKTPMTIGFYLGLNRQPRWRFVGLRSIPKHFADSFAVVQS